jgi:hypothetical protein
MNIYLDVDERQYTVTITFVHFNHFPFFLKYVCLSK